MNSILISQLSPSKISLDLQCWTPSGICKILHNQCRSIGTIRAVQMNTSPSARGFSKISSSVLSEVENLHNYDDDLQQLIHPELMPKHVAFIMDGFSRWAKDKGLPVHEGHTLILPKLKEICNIASKLGIQVVTAFVFSTENWMRSKVEVDFLMQQFEELFDEFMRFGVRVSVIGDRSNLPKTLQNCIALTEEATKDDEGLHLVIALNYGGQYDILQATKGIASKVMDGSLQLEDINKNLFEHELESNCAKFPNPDLIIRTGGEQRVSNFLLWQLAYSEFYFTKTPCPDFGEKDFTEALLAFQNRHRRFGGHTY